MAFSLPQFESNAKFSPIPEQDIEQGHQEKAHIGSLYDEGSESSWDFLVATLRLSMIGMFLFLLTIYVKHLEEYSDPIQPKFFVNSLRVSHFNITDGELSASWDVNLTLINVMNDANIRIGTMEASLMYKENETLAVVTMDESYGLFESEVSLMKANEEKRMNFKFSTTGWEKEQPIIDTVIQEIAKDWERGLIRFGMQMKMRGDLEFDEWVVPFIMYPCCNDLVVQFTKTSALPSVAANLIDGGARECSSVIEYEYV